MSLRVYRDAPIKNPALKQIRVLPEIQKIWDELCSLRSKMNELYYKCNYGWPRANVDDVKELEVATLKAMSVYLKKEDFDLDYVMRSQQYIFGQAIAFIECEDEEPLRQFETCYYMDYFDLGSAANLQGYFALRTRLRRYEYIETTAYSPLYLYVYELLNLIGVKDEHEALKKLVWLKKQYGVWEADDVAEFSDVDQRRTEHYDESYVKRHNFSRNLEEWIREFGWYYGCDDAIGKEDEDLFPNEDMSWQTQMLEKIKKLENIEQLSDDDLVAEILKFAGSDVNRSIFREKHKQDFDRILVKLYRGMDSRARKRYAKSWIEKHTKRQRGYRRQYQFFSNAVFFYDEHKNKSIGRKPINTPFHRVSFPERKGEVWHNTYEVANTYIEFPYNRLHAMLKYLDYTMRSRTQFRAQIKKPEIRETDARLVDNTISKYFEEKREQQVQERLNAIEINSQQLESIRSDAEITRDSLLTEDELEAPISIAEDNTLNRVEADLQYNKLTTERTVNLTPRETELITKLINSEKCSMSSLEVDQINNKFYPIIGDNILELDNDSTTLYNDYIDDVKGLLS